MLIFDFAYILGFMIINPSYIPFLIGPKIQGGGGMGIPKARLGGGGGGGPTPPKKMFDISDKPKLVMSYCQKRQFGGLVGHEDGTENCFNDLFNRFGDAWQLAKL